MRDLTGVRFGRLVVISKSENLPDPHKPRGRTAWYCVCDCGNKKTVLTDSLNRGNTQSCGCFWVERMAITKRKDFTGRRFGKLTVNTCVGKGNHGIEWLCVCDCGETITCSVNSLLSGTQSCGCSRRRLAPHIAQMNRAYRSFLGNAKRRNLKVEIKKEDWLTLVSTACHYCGVENSNRWKVVNGCYGNEFFCNGIDRKNSSLGYTIDNCVSCCKLCNDAKGILEANSFIELVNRICQYQSVNHAQACN